MATVDLVVRQWEVLTEGGHDGPLSSMGLGKRSNPRDAAATWSGGRA